MLDSIKHSYEQCADFYLPEWRKTNKNILIRECTRVDKDSELYQAYVSAIMLRYWNLITKYYYSNSSSVSPEDVYGWLLDSVLYALQCQQWNNPDKAVYDDPSGPDKVINRCMLSARQMFYQSSNCVKRKVNYQLYSIDKLKEDVGDSAFPAEMCPEIEDVLDLSSSLVIRAFHNKDYFSCAVIDNIAHNNAYDLEKTSEGIFTQFNPKKLAHLLRCCDSNYYKTFSKRYNVDTDEMEHSLYKMNKYSSEKMYKLINRTLEKLRNNKELREMFIRAS